MYQLYPHFTPILSRNRGSLERLENRDQLAPRYVHVSPRVRALHLTSLGSQREGPVPGIWRGREEVSMLAPERRSGIAAMTGRVFSRGSSAAFSRRDELGGILCEHLESPGGLPLGLLWVHLCVARCSQCWLRSRLRDSSQQLSGPRWPRPWVEMAFVSSCRAPRENQGKERWWIIMQTSTRLSR